MPENPLRALTVEVFVPSAVPSFSGAPLRVILEDVSMADRPAVALARAEMSELDHRQGRNSCFRALLPLPQAAEGTRHELSAHLDVDRDGAFSRGDLINMESYPVELDCPPPLVRIELRRIE